MGEIQAKIDYPNLSEKETRYQVIRSNFQLLKFNTEYDVEFLKRLEALDSRLKTPRTAEMLGFYYTAWGNQIESDNYFRIQKERTILEENIFQKDLISVTEQLLVKFGAEATRTYVFEKRGQYPQDYLIQNWPDITL